MLIKRILGIFFSVIGKIIKNHYVNLAAGIAMIISSLDGIQGTLWTDIVQLNFRVHHGVWIMGIWKILESMPNIYDSLSWINNSKNMTDSDNDRGGSS